MFYAQRRTWCGPREWRDLPVQGTTGGHAACKAADPGLLEIGNAEDVGSNDSHGV